MAYGLDVWRRTSDFAAWGRWEGGDGGDEAEEKKGGEGEHVADHGLCAVVSSWIGLGG